MAVSILEALQNAQMNLKNVRVIGSGIIPLIQSQLNNAVGLLEKRYSLEEEVEPLLEEYGDIESVPEKK